MLLSEDFKTAKVEYLKQGYEENIINSYINKFKKLKNSYASFLKTKTDVLNLDIPAEMRVDIDQYKDFTTLEKVVDYAAGQIKLDKEKVNDVKVTNSHTVYEDGYVEIMYGDTPNACITIKGDYNTSWCVARNDDSNMYYRYRLGDHYLHPSFYFVKVKSPIYGEDSKFDFIVIRVTSNGQYIVTNSYNDGDIPMSWLDICNINPHLKTLEYIFKYHPLSIEEKQYGNFKNGLSDEEYANIPFETKKFYIDVKTILTGNQFINTPYELQYYYINSRYKVEPKIFNAITKNPKLLKRYFEVADWSDIIKQGIKPQEIDYLMSIRDYNNSKAIYALLKASKQPKYIVEKLGEELIYNHLNNTEISNIITANLYYMDVFTPEFINKCITTHTFLSIISKKIIKADKYKDYIAHATDEDISIILNNLSDKDHDVPKIVALYSDEIKKYLNNSIKYKDKRPFLSISEYMMNNIKLFCPFFKKLFKTWPHELVTEFMANRYFNYKIFQCTDNINLMDYNVFSYIGKADNIGQRIIKKGLKFGIIDSEGKILVEPIYDEIGKWLYTFRRAKDYSGRYLKLGENGNEIVV